MANSNKIIKKNKLYFSRPRDEARRRLDKFRMNIYIFIWNFMVNEGGIDQYNLINKDCKLQTEFQPLTLHLSPELDREAKQVIGDREHCMIYYNGTHQKLIKLKYSAKDS